MEAIEVRNLVKRYRGSSTAAVEDVSFKVPEGSFFCLLGPNGAGKTTVVSILTTVLEPTSGVIRIAGFDLASEQSRIRSAIGVVFQEQALDLNLTAEENLRLHAIVFGLYPWRPLQRLMPAAYRKQIEDLTGMLGVGEILGKPVRSLSGGTRRKLEIARTLMHRPRVLFLDEPTAGLDPESRRSLWAHLSQVREREGTTVFLTTHYLQEAEGAESVCVLADGRVAASGRPDQLKKEFGEASLEAAYLGLMERSRR